MQPHDWSRFTLRVPIKAEPKEVFAAWTTRQGLESWFLRKAVFKTEKGKEKTPGDTIVQGDTYEWMWHGWPDEVVEKGTVLSNNEKNTLKFSFGKAGNVQVEVKEAGGDTLVELLQYDIPTTEEGQVNYHIGCTKGWLFYLANLKSVLEGGLDLRNRKVELKDVINS